MPPAASQPEQESPAMNTSARPRPGCLSWLLRLIIVLLAALALLLVSVQLSPRPGTWLIARLFDMGSDNAARALEKHVPAGISSQTDLIYSEAPVRLGLDIHRPAQASGRLPTVVWIHGGGWISGDKGMLANYLKVLAGRGVVTVSLDYTLAPDARYPEQVRQTNQALGWLLRHADRLNLDMDRVFLAGDSAGSQIAAQLANVITAPDYARRVGITPALDARRLRGMLLFCGPFDFAMFNWHGALAWPLKTTMWALTGERDFQHHRIMDEASVLRHVSPAFPPSFISVGNADPLMPQSRALAERLRALAVPVDSLFFDATHQPALAHEYQFTLDGKDGKIALARAVQFIQKEARP